MSKVVMIFAAVVLSAGTTLAQASKTTVRPGDRNVAHNSNKTECGRLQPGLLGDNTNTPVKSQAREGSTKSGRD